MKNRIVHNEKAAIYINPKATGLYADPNYEHEIEVLEIIFGSYDSNSPNDNPDANLLPTLSVYSGSGEKEAKVKIIVHSEKEGLEGAWLECLDLPTIFKVNTPEPGQQQIYTFTNQLEETYNTGWDKFHFNFKDGATLDPILSIKRPT